MSCMIYKELKKAPEGRSIGPGTSSNGGALGARQIPEENASRRMKTAGLVFPAVEGDRGEKALAHAAANRNAAHHHAAGAPGLHARHDAVAATLDHAFARFVAAGAGHDAAV